VYANILLWLARGLTGLELLLAITPLIPTGFWLVRLCDGPRLQMAILALVALLLVVWHSWLVDWKMEHGVLIALLSLAAFWQFWHVAKYTSVWPKEVPIANLEAETDLKILVVNLQIDNKRTKEAVAMLREQDSDVLLLMELDEAWSEALEPLTIDYPHRCEEVRDEGLGIGLWSKLPLSNAEVRHLVSERRASIFAEIEMKDGRSFNFIGLHPTPPGLQDSTPGGRRYSRVRDAELILVAREVGEKPDEAWVVAGDFNDVAWSHTSRLFSRLSGLKDPRVGRGLYNSYHADYPLFRFPIDQTFFSDGFELKKLGRLRTPGSDHFAISTEVSLKQETGVDPKPVSNDEAEAKKLVEEGIEHAEERDIKSEEADERKKLP